MEAVAREDHHGSLHPVGAFAFHQPVCLGSVQVCVGRSVRGDLPIDQEMSYPNVVMLSHVCSCTHGVKEWQPREALDGPKEARSIGAALL